MKVNMCVMEALVDSASVSCHTLDRTDTVADHCELDEHIR